MYDLESDENVSLPSDFEEDILSCGNYSCEVESNANSDIFDIEDDVISSSSSLYEYPEESVGYLFCHLCGISKPAGSFSEVQQKEADLEGSAYFLIHHHGSITLVNQDLGVQMNLQLIVLQLIVMEQVMNQ